MANYVKTDGPSSPTIDNAFDIGSEEKRFNDIYAQTFHGTAILANNLTISANEGDVLVYTNSTLRWAASSAFATKSFVTQQIADINNNVQINLEGYVTDLELENAVQTALQTYNPNIDLSSYALKTQLFSGSYNDLSDVPVLVVSYNDLTDKPIIPTVPTNVSSFTNDAGYITSHQDLSLYALKTELFSGSYNDLTDTPVIPTVPTNVSSFTNDSGYALQTELFSGSYNDLTDTPTIPSLAGYATETYVDNAVTDAISNGTVDLSNYYTKTEVDTSINNIALTPGPKGDTGDTGPAGSDGTNGVDGTNGIDGADGVSVTNAALNINDDLIITLSNSTSINVGNVRGPQGPAGQDGVDGINGIDGTSYTDIDVDAHLNTSTATTGEVLSWNGTDYDWIAQSSGGSTYGDTDVAAYLNTNLDTHIIPNTNATYDIGSAEKKIRHFYLSNNSLYIGDELNTLSTSGNTLLFNGEQVQVGSGGGTAYDQSLNTTDVVEFAGITTSELTITGVGNTTITSGANVQLNSPNRVEVTQSPFRLAHMTNAERDTIIAVDGDMIYNTDDSNFQVYTQGQWFRLSLTPIV